MSVVGWMIAVLIWLMLMVIVFALIQAGTGISPDEEARLLAEERRRREMKEAQRRANISGKIHRGRKQHL